MDNVLDIAASGLGAASTLMQSAAQNVANKRTPGYKAEQVVLADATEGGVAVERIQAGPDGDAVAESVEFRRGQSLYDANAIVIATQEQMFGSLINILDTQPAQPSG